MSIRLNAAIFCSILFCTAMMQGADRIKVTILEQKDSQSQYNGVIPGHTNATSNTNVNCAEYGSNVNCNGTTNTHATATPARRVTYGVSGAALSLLLPDGRIAIVNCESKYAMKGDYVNRRSCRVPLVGDIEAEFKGDKAKLFWPVSIDGKKFASETYKVVAIRDKQ